VLVARARGGSQPHGLRGHARVPASADRMADARRSRCGASTSPASSRPLARMSPIGARRRRLQGAPMPAPRRGRRLSHRPAALRLAGRIRSRATLNRPQPPELGEEPPRVHRVRRAQDDLTVCLAHDVPSVTQAGARPPTGQVQVDAPTAPEGHLALALAGRAGARVPLAHSGRRQRSWRPTPAPPRVSAHRLPRTRR
jgi:hypothetical protein